MELEERKTLHLVEQKLVAKIHSFQTWDEFITWAKEITGPKFKEFIVECIDEVMGDGDLKKADLLEIKARFEAP